MKVKDLIRQLKKADENDEVVIFKDNHPYRFTGFHRSIATPNINGKIMLYVTIHDKSV